MTSLPPQQSDGWRIVGHLRDGAEYEGRVWTMHGAAEHVATGLRRKLVPDAAVVPVTTGKESQ